MAYRNKYCYETFSDCKFEEIEFVKICENWPTLNLPLGDNFIKGNINALKFLKNTPDVVYPTNFKQDYFSLRPEDFIVYFVGNTNILTRKLIMFLVSFRN